ncbi:MAG TPA: hypothetical protein VLH16_06490, partial [Bacteroidales bacterium]|nr:hypothetical protein [Bacteroidales bacterium]
MTTKDNPSEVLHVDLLIIHAQVVTMDCKFRVINDGAVAVAGSQIIDVGTTAELQERYCAAEVVDASRKIMLPGLINAHTHSPLTIFRGLADDLALDDWLYNHIFPAEKEFVTPDSVQLGTELAIA